MDPTKQPDWAAYAYQLIAEAEHRLQDCDEVNIAKARANLREALKIIHSKSVPAIGSQEKH